MTAFELLLHVSTLMMLAAPFLILAFCATLVFGKENISVKNIWNGEKISGNKSNS